MTCSHSAGNSLGRAFANLSMVQNNAGKFCCEAVQAITSFVNGHRHFYGIDPTIYRVMPIASFINHDRLGRWNNHSRPALAADLRWGRKGRHHRAADVSRAGENNN